ncbi:phage minor head protein [Lysinibacillus antri]|nr:phage minor head protein [Lysinibacillus antri]
MDLEKYARKLSEWNTKELAKTEKSIRTIYQKLVKEVLAQIGLIYEKYETDGKLTYEQMMQYDRLKKLMNTIIEHVNAMSKQTQTVITTLLSESYMYSYEWMGWAIEKEARKAIGYTSLAIEQIKAAINNPVKGLTLSETLEKNRRDIIYKIQQNVTQSLVRGSTYKEMASSMTEMFEGDYTKSIRVTRTETHRVREQGTLDSAKYANSKGIIMVKKWRNMKDSRVRKTPKANHVKMDHVKIPVNDLFDLGNGEKGIAPGNTGYAHHDIHCRCILIYEIDKVEGKTNDDLAKQTFEEFQKAMR